MTQQNRNSLKRNTLKQKRNGKRIPKPVAVRSHNSRKLKHGGKVSRPVRGAGGEFPLPGTKEVWGAVIDGIQSGQYFTLHRYLNEIPSLSLPKDNTPVPKAIPPEVAGITDTEAGISHNEDKRPHSIPISSVPFNRRDNFTKVLICEGKRWTLVYFWRPNGKRGVRLYPTTNETELKKGPKPL